MAATLFKATNKASAKVTMESTVRVGHWVKEVSCRSSYIG